MTEWMEADTGPLEHSGPSPGPHRSHTRPLRARARGTGTPNGRRAAGQATPAPGQGRAGSAHRATPSSGHLGESEALPQPSRDGRMGTASCLSPRRPGEKGRCCWPANRHHGEHQPGPPGTGAGTPRFPVEGGGGRAGQTRQRGPLGPDNKLNTGTRAAPTVHELTPAVTVAARSSLDQKARSPGRETGRLNCAGPQVPRLAAPPRGATGHVLVPQLRHGGGAERGGRGWGAPRVTAAWLTAREPSTLAEHHKLPGTAGNPRGGLAGSEGSFMPRPGCTRSPRSADH